MTEAEWLACDSPAALLRFLAINGRLNHASACLRKLRLFGCACCRRVWHLIEPHPVIAECVEFAERYADGTGAKKRLRKLAEQNRSLYQRYGEGRGEDLSVAFVGGAARSVCEPHLGEEVVSVCGDIGWAIGRNNWADYPSQVVLLRDIFGNPFRPVAFTPEWRTDTAVTLARQMYESREFGPMPTLADALQDAGCDNDDILAHCRDTARVHVRGCWVCDRVLGKE